MTVLHEGTPGEVGLVVKELTANFEPISGVFDRFQNVLSSAIED